MKPSRILRKNMFSFVIKRLFNQLLEKIWPVIWIPSKTLDRQYLFIHQVKDAQIFQHLSPYT